MQKSGLNIKIYHYVPKETDPVIVDKFIEYLIRRMQKLNPGDPPQSPDVLRSSALEQNPHMANIRVIAYAPELDRVVGGGHIEYEIKLSPAYEQNKNACYAAVAVEESYRNRGIARYLFREVVKIIEQTGRQVVRSYVEEIPGHEMVRSLGFGEVVMEGAENRLYLKDVNWDLMNQWKKEGPERSPTTSLISFYDAADDLITKFTQFYTTAVNTIPKGDMEWGAAITPESRKIEEMKYHKVGSIWRTSITTEKDGEISGMTEMIYNEKEPHYAVQELTAVLPKYRGRGLGKWLKASMLVYMHETYPAIKYIVTENADVNAPMLSINNKMGFRRYREGTFYRFNIGDLVKKYLKD